MSEDLVRALAKSEKRIAQLEQVSAEHRHFRDPQWDEWCRRSNRYGRAQYTDHFRSGTIPTGYAWLGAPFGGAPAVLDYSHNGTYMELQCNASPHFLATNITVYTSKHFVGRFCTARNTFAGIRVDDGTNNNYCVWGLDAGTNGSYTPKFIEVAGGGGPVSNTAHASRDSEFTSLLMYHYASDPSFVGYFVNEAGGWSYADNCYSNIIAWTPARIGLYYTFNGGYYAYTDMFYSTFA